MTVLAFTLTGEAVNILRDALICLNKISDEVSLEARHEKSAYACFSFTTNRFFSKFKFQGTPQNSERFFCTLYTRVLISIFRSRGSGDPQKESDRLPPIERCEVTIEDGTSVRSRFVTRIIFRNGCTATHQIPFQVSLPAHGKFHSEEVSNHWTVPARTLRQLMEHFGPGIELLDIFSDGSHVNFNCYSEKAVNADEVLKKPLQTSIAMDLDEFDDLEIEDSLHIIISVRDFRAIIQHAGSMGSELSAQYSLPAKPIKLAYQGDGISCEFLLMTVGERGPAARKSRRSKAGAAPPASNTKQVRQGLEVAKQPVVTSSRSANVSRPSGRANAPLVSQNSSTPVPSAGNASSTRDLSFGENASKDPRPSMPAPPAPPPPASYHNRSITSTASTLGRTSFFDIRPQQSQITPRPSRARSPGLFVDDMDDNDGQWEPLRTGDDEDQDGRLEWDHQQRPGRNYSRVESNGQTPAPPEPEEETFLEPTQRLDEARRFGLFYEDS